MTTRLTWTKQEDSFLRKLVSKQEKTNWNKIIQTLNLKFPNKIRSPKQCRERYTNYSSFDGAIDCISQWKSEDLDLLYSEFDKYGARWTKIAQYLPEKYIFPQMRSQNAIKNKFYGSLRKTIRKINMIAKASKKKIKKNIRYESVARIIQAAETFLTLSEDLKQESHELRQKILKLMRIDALDQAQEEAYELINRINKFNLATRSYRPRKVKKADQKDDAILRGSEQDKEKLNKQDDLDDNSGKMNSTSGSTEFSPNECFNLVKNNQKEIKKQNPQEIQSKIKDCPLTVFQFSPYMYLSQAEGKIRAQEQIDEYILDLFPERESPLDGCDLL